MPSLWSEVQLTYILIKTVFLGIFRAIDIGLHSRDFHTAQSAHSAVSQKLPWIAKMSSMHLVQRTQLTQQTNNAEEHYVGIKAYEKYLGLLIDMSW